MDNLFLNVGYNNYVESGKVLAIINASSAPVRRLIKEAKNSALLIDATAGHKTRSVIVTSSGQILLSAHLPQVLAAKAAEAKKA